MQLPAAGREYAHFPVSGAPEAASFEISFRQGGEDSDWAEMETVNATTVRVLLAGPDADPGDAVVLTLGRAVASIRLTDNPEIVVRSGGVVNVG